MFRLLFGRTVANFKRFSSLRLGPYGHEIHRVDPPGTPDYENDIISDIARNFGSPPGHFSNIYKFN